MIAYAQDAECEEKIYMRWVMWHQLYMGFEEFKEEIGIIHRKDDRDNNNKSADKILEKVRGIIG